MSDPSDVVRPEDKNAPEKPRLSDGIEPPRLSDRVSGASGLMSSLFQRFWWLKWVSGLFAFFAITGIVAAAAVGIYVARLSQDLPDYSALSQYQPAITTRVHAGDGQLIGEFAIEHRIFVPIDQIPERVRDAFLSAEDANFYEHGGVDFQGIMRAAVANVFNYLNNRRLEGGSTITQQVAKNFLLSSDVKLERKVKEALIAWRIEDAFTKDQILELYLNEIYLGVGAYGVASAALQYFDKSLDELSISEVAYLAALPKAPNNYHPVNNKERAIARRNYVIDRMADTGAITREEAAGAKTQDLVTVIRPLGTKLPEAQFFVEEVRRELYARYGEDGLYKGGLSVRSTLDTDYQYVAQRVLRRGLVAFDRTKGYRGPVAAIEITDEGGWKAPLKAIVPLEDVTEWTLAVVLSVTDARAEIGLVSGDRGHIPLDDLKWARPVDERGRLGAEVTRVGQVLKRGDVIYVEPVLAPEERQINKDKSPQPAQILNWSLQQVPEVNGGLVAIDPHTGRVLAMAGGFSFAGSEYNRATQARRQPGSSFKPFVYAAALDFEGGMRFTPSSLVLDGPFVLDQGPGLPLWKPGNYDEGVFSGPSTLRLGIEKSKNLMTVRLAQEIGMDMIMDYAYRFGIIDSVPEFKPLSMALGSVETTLLKLTSAYAVFVNGGKKVTPTLIDRVQDRFGKTLYRHDERVCQSCEETLWTEQDEPVLPDAREQIIDPRTAYQLVSMLEGVVQRGTGTAVKVVDRPLAGKTGTSNEERDAWFIGFSPDLAVGVYVGYDTPRPMGKGSTGGRLAAPIFRDFMQAVIGDKPAVPFRTPPGIRLVRVDPKTGQPAAPGEPFIVEAFKSGSEPSGESGPVLDNTPSAEDFQGDSGISGVVQEDDTSIDSGTGGLY